MLVAIDGKAAGLIALADPIRESAVDALKASAGSAFGW
jgi:cation transport ATPase